MINKGGRQYLFWSFFMLLSGAILMFLVAPVVGMFLSQSPSGIWGTARESDVAGSIKLTLWTSMAASLIAALGAIPLSYLLARKKFPGKKIVMGAVNLPVVIPHSAAGIALLGLIARDTILGQLAAAMGFELTGNPTAIMLAMAFVSVPFLINAATDAFSAVPESLEEAARNLGASDARVFFEVALPLARRGIISGLIMMWARGMSEFGAVVMVAYHPMVSPILIYERFTSFGLKYATPVAVLVVLISLIVFVGMRMIPEPGKLNKNDA